MEKGQAAIKWLAVFWTDPGCKAEYYTVQKCSILNNTPKFSSQYGFSENSKEGISNGLWKPFYSVYLKFQIL